MGLIEFKVAGIQKKVRILDLVIAGWTGRDAEAVERHIAELVAIGVERPETTPVYYRVGSDLLSTAENHDVIGTGSSGEVELMLLSLQDGLYIGLGSDHTDRKVERYNVAVSKQICPKPIGAELWPMSDVEYHWNQLELRSWVTCGGTRRLYQEGRMADLLSPSELIRRFVKGARQLDIGTVMFTGTVPVIGELTGSELFEMELLDPIKQRSLTHRYRTRCLPLAKQGEL